MRKIKIPQHLERAHEFRDIHPAEVTSAEVKVYQVGQTGQRWIDLTFKIVFAKVQLDDMASLLTASDTAPVATIFTFP
jgi:hypothetical protein